MPYLVLSDGWTWGLDWTALYLTVFEGPHVPVMVIFVALVLVFCIREIRAAVEKAEKEGE